MQELAKQHGVALLRSNETTCTMMGSLISVLNLELAPRITRHGVLADVFRRSTHDLTVGDLAQLHGIVGDEAVTAFDQLDGQLALADAAVAPGLWKPT